jgi:S-adenosylmethionine decarboxylase
VTYRIYPEITAPPAPEAASRAGTEIALDPRRLDHFIRKDGMLFAGTHLIVDLWDARWLDDIEHVRATLLAAAKAARATVLNVDLHHFSENGGVSGVVVLAESHISIHTWPETHYAALDIFTCGDSQPHEAVQVLREAFRAGHVGLQEIRRGVIA